MREDLIDEISNPENRLQDAVEFFGWPRELVQMMFKHSKEYFEGPWVRFYPNHVHEYYASGLYTIRQLSYSKDDIFTQGIRKFLDQIDGPCLDFACGVGDYCIYLASLGIKVYPYEYPGIAQEFLFYRMSKYGFHPVRQNLDIDVLPVVDYTLLISAIDHIPDPVSFVTKACQITRKRIFATPCIDETYDRPTHEKKILKHVPEAFKLIDEHNARH